MGEPERLSSIVIAGGGVTGWMAATALARFAPMMRVTVIDCPVDDVAVQATLPAYKDFHALIGVDEHEMLARSGGTMRLGTRFADLARPGGYLHAFGDFGLEVGGVAFYQLWLRARAAGQPVDLDDYNLAAIAATMGRFARPAADKRAMMDYGYHLDTALYAAFLRSLALAQGVGCEAGEIGSVTRDGESGRIAAILLRDGRSIEGDFFVDCTGAPAVLMEALDIGFEDWSGWFPSSREVAVDAGVLPDLPPLSSATAHLSGWERRLPLQHRTWHSFSFAPGETAEEAVPEALGDRGEGDPRFTTHRRGRRQRFWAGNCVALGAAAASIEPIEAGELDIASDGIAALLSLFPDRGDADAEGDEFDRIMSASIEAQRDLTLLHHVVILEGKAVLQMSGEARALPDSLAHRIKLFRGRGRLRPRDAGGFGPADWLAVLIGRGAIPASWAPLADTIDIPRAQQNFLRLAGLFRQSAETMPGHAAYIARHCAYRP
ncbi:MAG: tryptophan halogenase family protein [Sphingomonas sp.]|jgi:tryptophan halogenase|uniref:tryptophan halogenase family protein n=1 Tax=Sphingomonas sp. TaxID=28214 RepID=UPI003563D7C3